MTTARLDVSIAARMLIAAEDTRSDREPLSDEWPELDLGTAYRIQDEVLQAKLARGERLVGVKLGLTSAAKQRQMNVTSPITGWLTDAMALEVGQALPRHRLIHPRAEPEIVFVMGRRLAGPGVTTGDALDAVASVQVGLEVIDSRYRNFRFTLPDVVADNASAARFVLGPTIRDAQEVDLAEERCVLDVDGREVATARGSDVLGNPATALAMAANALAERGIGIEAGWMVLTGGMTDAVPAGAGATIDARFDELGAVRLVC